MDYLKPIFGDKALTFSEFIKALEGNKDIKLANLAEGQYVDKKKLDDKIEELNTANGTIADLQAAVKKFDGVDVDGLKTQISDLQSKYDKDTADLKLNSALDVALIGAKAKNPKLTKAALDMSIIKLDGDKVLGLDEQITKLKETDAYLFETDDGNNNQDPPPARVNSGGNHQQHNNPDYDKMTDEEYYAAVLKKD